MITMSEFIKKHKLNVDIKDSTATRLIANKLKGAGYRRVKRRHNGKVQWVWIKGEEERIKALTEKLEKIEL